VYRKIEHYNSRYEMGVKHQKKESGERQTEKGKENVERR
jgi:hypothetical protein